jgi:hypothetical protein
MQQRYYDPVAGRFLSIDPVVTDIHAGESFNRYRYASNNPYRYIDPDGRMDEATCAKMGKLFCTQGKASSENKSSDDSSSVFANSAISLLPFVGGAYGVLDDYSEGHYGSAIFNGVSVFADFASFGIGGTMMRGAKFGSVLIKAGRASAQPFFKTAQAATLAAEAMGFKK